VSAVDQHTEAHRLMSRGYGARRIARELGITRYAAEQLMKQPLPQPVAEPAADSVADDGRPVAELVSHLPDGGRRLVIDLDRFPGLAEDLALLQRTRASAEQVVDFAIDRLASVYRNALASGRLRDGQAFDVVDMRLRLTDPVGRAA